MPERQLNLFVHMRAAVWGAVKPAINQVETHVFQQQAKAHEIMEKYGVQHERWGPFAEGRNGFLK